jgi:hypothetical protein
MMIIKLFATNYVRDLRYPYTTYLEEQYKKNENWLTRTSYATEQNLKYKSSKQIFIKMSLISGLFILIFYHI